MINFLEFVLIACAVIIIVGTLYQTFITEYTPLAIQLGAAQQQCADYGYTFLNNLTFKPAMIEGHYFPTTIKCVTSSNEIITLPFCTQVKNVSHLEVNESCENNVLPPIKGI